MPTEDEALLTALDLVLDELTREEKILARKRETMPASNERAIERLEAVIAINKQTIEYLRELRSA